MCKQINNQILLLDTQCAKMLPMHIVDDSKLFFLLGVRTISSSKNNNTSYYLKYSRAIYSPSQLYISYYNTGDSIVREEYFPVLLNANEEIISLLILLGIKYFSEDFIPNHVVKHIKLSHLRYQP